MRYAVVDAFADRPFSGNPAAVVPLEADVADARLQAIAAEFNLAETAFVRPLGDGRWSLRWFTPVREVELCGHATMASAHALWEWGLATASEPIRFATRWRGELVCTRSSDRIAMDFPATPPEPVALPHGAARALGVEGPVHVVGRGPMCLVLRVPDVEQVRRLRPDPAVISRWHAVGVCVTAPGEGDDDLVSRFFAPQAGIPEDPVTGASHCVLGPYWAAELGKSDLRARQLSARGGALRLRVRGARVELGGSAVTTMRGEVVG